MSIKPVRTIAVYTGDAGSVARGNFGWARGRANDSIIEGENIEGLRDRILQDLNEGIVVALGFECPLFLPIPRDPSMLGKARIGECTPETGNRPFSAPAGACSTITGLVELAWLLRAIREAQPEVAGTLDWEDIREGRANLYLWEAFVTGKEKATSHASDAVLGVRAFLAAMSDPMAATAVSAEEPLSLAGAALVWSGMARSDSLKKSSPVLRPIPSI
ncbi:MAG: hypothetical protein AAB692_04965 [Patescibacteria group bacterium]